VLCSRYRTGTKSIAPTKISFDTYPGKSGFGGLDSVLAFGTQSSRVRTRPKSSDFLGEKILRTPSFGGEVKPSVPCRSFTACKRSLNVTWKPAFKQNSRKFPAHSSTVCRWVLSRGDTRGDAWWQKLERLTQIAQ
jgi:hypothetical protein